MNLVGKTGNAGAGIRGGCIQAAPANPLVVGEVGFGPTWDDEPSLRDIYDQACRTIVRMECEADELRAEVALAEAERIEMAKLLRSERQMHAQCQNEGDELREVMAEIVTWVEDDLRDTVDASYRKAVERAQKLTEGLR